MIEDITNIGDITLTTSYRIPVNRTYKLLKEERKLAHKFLVQQSKLIDFNPISKMTLDDYFSIILKAMTALCDEDGNYVDIYNNGRPLFNIYKNDREYLLRRIMDGRSLFHSDYGDSYGILNDIDHNDYHAFKDWVCNAHWGGHPYETLFGNIFPHCLYNKGFNFTYKLQQKKLGNVSLDTPLPLLDEEYSDKWILLISTSHRNDEYAIRCFIHLKKLGYPIVWCVDNIRDRAMLTKQYMVEKEKQPDWWDLTADLFN